MAKNTPKNPLRESSVLVKSPAFDEEIWPSESFPPPTQSQYCLDCMRKAHLCSCPDEVSNSQSDEEMSETTDCSNCDHLGYLLLAIRKICKGQQSASAKLQKIQALL